MKTIHKIRRLAAVLGLIFMELEGGELVRDLKLTLEQRERLIRYQRDWNRELDDWRKARPSEREQMAGQCRRALEETRRRINETLTPEQRVIWNDLVGKPSVFQYDVYVPLPRQKTSRFRVSYFEGHRNSSPTSERKSLRIEEWMSQRASFLQFAVIAVLPTWISSPTTRTANVSVLTLDLGLSIHRPFVMQKLHACQGQITLSPSMYPEAREAPICGQQSLIAK